MIIFARAHIDSADDLTTSLRYLSHPNGLTILRVNAWSPDGNVYVTVLKDDGTGTHDPMLTPEELRLALNVPDDFKRLLVPDEGGVFQRVCPNVRFNADKVAELVRVHSLCMHSWMVRGRA